MEDVVAVRVELADGRSCYYLTWGRIQDPVDPKPLESLILRHAQVQLARHRPVEARVTRLAEASKEPWFFESFFGMAQRQIPFGPGYGDWKKKTRRRMREGRDIWFLGLDGESDPLES